MDVWFCTFAGAHAKQRMCDVRAVTELTGVPFGHQGESPSLLTGTYHGCPEFFALSIFQVAEEGCWVEVVCLWPHGARGKADHAMATTSASLFICR